MSAQLGTLLIAAFRRDHPVSALFACLLPVDKVLDNDSLSIATNGIAPMCMHGRGCSAEDRWQKMTRGDTFDGIQADCENIKWRTNRGQISRRFKMETKSKRRKGHGCPEPYTGAILVRSMAWYIIQYH